MRDRLLLLGAFLLLSFQLFAQKDISLDGYVKDEAGAPLSGAAITVNGKHFVTNSAGYYHLLLNPGTFQMMVSYTGMQSITESVTIVAGSKTTKDYILQPANTLADVTVGSRSRIQRTMLTTAVPVDVISMKNVQNLGQVDVSQMLTLAAPSFQSSRQSITDGTDHIDPASLRGLGPDQTLVLVNGKRRYNTALVNINGSVGRGSVGTDMNAIPSAAIDHIEILRDGAAAQYGSDAIAGVINVVLKQKYNGFTINALGGGNVTNMPYYDTHRKYNDGSNKQVDFSFGRASTNGAYFNISGQWAQRGQTNRSWDDNAPFMYIGKSATSFPTYNSALLPTGVTATQWDQWLLDQDAALVKKNGYDRHNIIYGQSSNTNLSGFLNAGIHLGHNFEAYLTAGGGYRTGQSAGNSRPPSAISQQPQTTTGPLYPNGFLPQIHTKIQDASIIAGIKGSVLGWHADLSNTFGRNSIIFTVENSGNASTAPSATPQTKFAAGTQQFSQNVVNLDFSKDYIFSSKQTLNVAFGGEYRYEVFELKAGEPNSYNTGTLTSISGYVPTYPGGSAYTTTDVPAPGAQVFPGLQPSNALTKNRGVYAGYASAEYTVGKLLLGAAGRLESYKENSADVTYNGSGIKFSARYELTPNVSLRGSYGTGFRAASLQQRYYNSTSTQFLNGIPSNTLTANNVDPIVRGAFGINGLKPETSKDYTAGFAAKLGNGFTLTVDGYLIQIKDRVVLSSTFNRSNTIVDSIMTAYGVSSSTKVLQFWTNAINTETKGLDIVLNKSYQLGKGHGNVSLAANFNKNTVTGALNTNSIIDKYPTLRNTIFDRQQRTRLEKGTPSSKINFSANYAIAKWDFDLRLMRFGSTRQVGTTDPTLKNSDGSWANDIALQSDQTFSAKMTTDLVINYKIIPAIVVTAGVNNLFDVYPDPVYIDPRNSAATVYATPIATGNKLVGGYNSSRDLSNRGRTPFSASQFGYNGRFLFGRLSFDLDKIILHK